MAFDYKKEYKEFYLPALKPSILTQERRGLFSHEIYLSDPRKTEPDKLKTVIRYPVKK